MSTHSSSAILPRARDNAVHLSINYELPRTGPIVMTGLITVCNCCATRAYICIRIHTKSSASVHSSISTLDRGGVMGPGCWVAGAGCVRSVVLWPLWGGVLVSGAWGSLHCGCCRCVVLSVVRFRFAFVQSAVFFLSSSLRLGFVVGEGASFGPSLC